MLSQYITETRRLLRDTNSTFYTDAELADYVNAARRRICTNYGVIRKLIPGTQLGGSSAVPGSAYPGATTPNSTNTAFQTIANVERYAYGYANPFARRYTGIGGISDVITVAVSWAGDSSQTGVLRPALDWCPFEDFQAYWRAYNQVATSFPSIWSTTGDGDRGEVYLFPIPGQALEMEWDCFLYPLPLADNGSFEAIPTPYTDSIKYYAAYLAYLATQRFGMADTMLQLFEVNTGFSRVGSDRGKTPSFYAAR